MDKISKSLKIFTESLLDMAVGKSVKFISPKISVTENLYTNVLSGPYFYKLLLPTRFSPPIFYLNFLFIPF